MTQQDDNVQRISDIELSANLFVEAGLGMSFAKVVENSCVLKCAENYISLCADLQKNAELRSKKRTEVHLPSDLFDVEKAVAVLCAAYVQAWQNKDEDVRVDIEKLLSSLSGFYQSRVAKAYFSACNILFDADGAVDKPELLSYLKKCRNSLQKVHCSWSELAEDTNLPLFLEKTDYYGRQLGIDGRVQPEKKAEKVFILPHISSKMVVKERCA